MNSNPTQPAPAGESRRSFIRKTAAATAAVGTLGLLRTPLYGQSQAPSANVTGANNRIVIGIIGTGNQGSNHIRLLSRRSAENNVAIGAVSDVFQKRLDQARTAAGLDAAGAFRDHRRLLERKDIDAVLIAAVDNWHGPASVEAVDAGKHVYCEKPMTRYVKEGWDVYDAVKRTGKVYQGGSQYTGDPMIHKAAEWIRAGKIGPLVWAQGSYCRNNPRNSEWSYPVDSDANPGNLDWERWLGGAPRIPWNPDHYFSWHKYHAYNSGLIGNLLSHRFLPLMLATGNPEYPRRVCCTGTRKISTDRDITDTTHILAEFPSGLTYVIAGSTVNEQGLPDVIRGRKATLYLSATQNRVELRPERIAVEDGVELEEFASPDPVGSIPNLHKNFFDCIRNGGTPFCNAELSVRANTVLCLAEMSERLGLTLFYDEKTRAIKTADGKVITPMTYDTVVPELG